MSHQLSPKDIRKQLRIQTNNHPITLGTGVVTVLGITGLFLFQGSALFGGFLILLSAGGLGLSAFLLNSFWFNKQKKMIALVTKYQIESEKKRLELIEELKKGLENVKDKSSLVQLNQLEIKFKAFTSILDLQFDRDELSHQRYLSNAEQLYLAAVDNLRQKMNLWLSISAINVEHINGQLSDQNTDAQTQVSLKQRLGIYNEALSKMEKIMSVNESAMTKLDEISAKLAAIQNKNKIGDVGLDQAMNDIAHLIDLAEQY